MKEAKSFRGRITDILGSKTVNIFLILIELFAISEPAFLMTKFPGLTTYWRVVFTAAFVVVTVQMLSKLDLNDVLKLVLPLGAYIIIIVSTYTNDGLLKSAVYRLWYYSYGLMLVCVHSRGDYKLFLRILRDVLLLLILANLVTELIWPKGMYYTTRISGNKDSRYWLLGFKNGIPKYAVISMTVSLVYAFITKKKKDMIIALITVAASAATVVIIKSSSGVMGVGLMIVLLALLLIPKLKFILKYYRMRFFSIFMAVLFLGIVVTHVLLKNPLSSYVIRTLFHKNITLSNRIYIWDNIIQMVLKNPLGGIGLQNGDINVQLIGVTANATDAHDYYLEFLWEGGIGAFVLIVLFFVLMTEILDRHKEDMKVKVLSAGLFSMMFIFITENCNNYYLWVFFGLMLFLPARFKKNELPIPKKERTKKAKGADV